MYNNMLARAGLVAACALGAVQAIATITATGSKFFDSDGNQFYLKGIAYQLTEKDPLVDTTQCNLDASLMKTLGANSIRVYHVDPNGNHDGCMSAFEDAGIYLFVDLDTFTTQIDTDQSTFNWNQTQYTAFQKVMDAFVKYNNTAGFFIGNEVIALNNQSNAAPYIKAATRDLKAYRDQKKYRQVPIGYSAADISELRPALQNYLACGGNTSESIDFFGLNAYEWCGTNDFQTSGYATLNGYAEGFPVPIFFSETGCRTVKPRTFEDQGAIFGSEMNSIWSGAIIYEWIEEANDYGLISYGPMLDATATGDGVQDGATRTGTPMPVTPDFSNLQAQWSTLTSTGTPSSAYTPSLTASSCPASTSGGWLVDGNVPLPTIGQALTTGAGGVTRTGSTASATGSASASSTKKGDANGGKEVAGMCGALMGVMFGVVYWL